MKGRTAARTREVVRGCWMLAASALFAPSATSAPGETITPRVEVNRRSGVAPLAVFFDTTGTKAQGSKRPFHELEYSWDFGDPQSGTFAPSGLPRNRAKGPLAGHVFERPGHYEVSLSVRDREGRVVKRAVPIDVLDPELVYAREATICFANRVAFEGCPSGALRVAAWDLGALAPHVRRGVRLLLRRGDTFTARSPLLVNVRGPSQLGAFGSGPRPRILPDGVAFQLSDEAPDLADWTLMDLDLEGRGNERAAGVLVNGSAENLLLLRLRAAHLGDAFSAPPDILDHYSRKAHAPLGAVDGLAIVDSEARELVGPGVLSYIGARRLLLLGNRYYDSTSGQHVLRLPYVERGVLSSNSFGKAPAGRHVIKLHARSFARGKYTERVLLSENRIESSGGHAWTVAIGPQNAESDERVRDVIVERNQFTLGGGCARVALALFASDVTVRDNRFERGTEPICVAVARRGKEPPPARITLRGNVCEGDGENPPELVELDGTATEVVLDDNRVTATHQ